MEERSVSYEEMIGYFMQDSFNVKIYNEVAKLLTCSNTEGVFTVVEKIISFAVDIMVFYKYPIKTIAYMRASVSELRLIPFAQEFMLRLALEVAEERLYEKDSQFKFVKNEILRTNYEMNTHGFTEEQKNTIKYFTGKDSMPADPFIDAILRAWGFLKSKEEEVSDFIKLRGDEIEKHFRKQVLIGYGVLNKKSTDLGLKKIWIGDESDLIEIYNHCRNWTTKTHFGELALRLKLKNRIRLPESMDELANIFWETFTHIKKADNDGNRVFCVPYETNKPERRKDKFFGFLDRIPSL